MKKLSVICMTILAVAFMASCRGPQGPAGHDGHDGNDANVSSSTVTVKSSDWEWNNANGQWVVTIDYPAINNNVYNYGAVLVYMDVSGAWSQVPLTYYYQDLDNQGNTINCEASIEVATLSDGAVRLFWTESDFYDEMRPETHDFKIVAIEAAVYDIRSDVDYSDYEAVKTAFQLAD
jgi:hypothetical protein